MSASFARFLLVLLGLAAVVGLLVAALVFSGGPRRAKRYRPGRPFEFAPVWFLAAKPGQARAGLVSGRELTTRTAIRSSGAAFHGATPVPGALRQIGGASERW